MLRVVLDAPAPTASMHAVTAILATRMPHLHPPFIVLIRDDMLERQQGGLSKPPEREGGSSQCPARTNLRGGRCPDCVPTGEQDFDDPRPDEVAGVGDAQGGSGHRALTPSPFLSRAKRGAVVPPGEWIRPRASK
uniref:Uncharacterized protein n=2 Tax=Zea mays TaxID=4577 RepID=A0A804QRC7_MAIZE